MPERPQSDDTSLLAERQQFSIWSRLSPADKFAEFAKLMQRAKAIAEAGIRMRHPDASEREVFLRRAAQTLERSTMIECYGWDPASSADPSLPSCTVRAAPRSTQI